MINPLPKARRIDGAIVRVDLRSNVVAIQPGGFAHVRGAVAEFLTVLLTCHPIPATRRKVVRGMYPAQSMRPRNVDNAIRTVASRTRHSLRPLGFTVVSVRPVHADVPCAYRLSRLATPPKRGVMAVPSPKGLEP